MNNVIISENETESVSERVAARIGQIYCTKILNWRVRAKLEGPCEYNIDFSTRTVQSAVYTSKVAFPRV
eukprot:11976-Pyramimonas_sp.AAC.1